MKQTLVTGGSGFIGQHLVEALLAKGRRVRILDVRAPNCERPGSEYVAGSVLNPNEVRNALDGVDEVYHLAALPGMWVPHKDDFHAVNCRGTEVVIDAARAAGVANFLHCSTESILFGPSEKCSIITEKIVVAPEDMPGAYTRSKMLAEHRAAEAAAAGFPLVIANPTMPIGPHHGNLTPPTLMVGYFLARRFQFFLDFIVNLVDVRDVAAGLLLTMERGQRGGRYILGGEDIPLKHLLRLLETMSGRKAMRLAVPPAMALKSAAVMEFIADHLSRRPPAATVEGVQIALRSRALSIEKSRQELGYAPRPVEQALRETIDAFLVAS